MTNCPHCKSRILSKAGLSRGKQKFRCLSCNRLFSEGASRRAQWTPEEDETLILMAQTPDLKREYNAIASSKKWPLRTKASLVARLERLGQSRYDNSSGWMTRSQLLKTLGLTENNAFSFSAWVSAGLPVRKEENGFHRVFVGDFVRWCLSPSGQGYAAKFLSKNKSVAAWFLSAINEWQFVENPLSKKVKKK